MGGVCFCFGAVSESNCFSFEDMWDMFFSLALFQSQSLFLRVVTAAEEMQKEEETGGRECGETGREPYKLFTSTDICGQPQPPAVSEGSRVLLVEGTILVC